MQMEATANKTAVVSCIRNLRKFFQIVPPLGVTYKQPVASRKEGKK